MNNCFPEEYFHDEFPHTMLDRIIYIFKNEMASGDEETTFNQMALVNRYFFRLYPIRHQFYPFVYNILRDHFLWEIYDYYHLQPSILRQWFPEFVKFPIALKPTNWYQLVWDYCQYNEEETVGLITHHPELHRLYKGQSELVKGLSKWLL